MNHYDDAVDGLAAAFRPPPPAQAAGGSVKKKEKKSRDSAAGDASPTAPMQSTASGKVHVVESITVDTALESVALLEVSVYLHLKTQFDDHFFLIDYR